MRSIGREFTLRTTGMSIIVKHPVYFIARISPSNASVTCTVSFFRAILFSDENFTVPLQDGNHEIFVMPANRIFRARARHALAYFARNADAKSS